MQFGSVRLAAAEVGEKTRQGNFSPPAPGRHSGATLIDALLVHTLAGRKALLRLIAEWRRRAAERRELMTLTDRDLHDIRIGRIEAEAEANKPFWEP